VKLGKLTTTAMVHRPGCEKPDVAALCECGQNVDGAEARILAIATVPDCAA
jgi:hypothetical protein